MPPKSKQKKSTAPVAVPKASNARSDVPKPDWPSLTPLADPSDLSVSSLLQNQIVTISNFWTSSLCRKYVSFLSGLPLVTTPGIPKRGDAVRVNDRFQINDEVFARQLWEGTALQDLVINGDIDGRPLSPDERAELWGGKVLGLNPNIRIYRYSKGQFFDQHCMYTLSVLRVHPCTKLFRLL